MTNRLARDFSNVNLSGRSSGDQVSAGKINGFELKVAPKSTVFRYDVEIIKINERKQKILTNQSDPSVRTVQREACSDIIEALFMITGGFGVECKYVYDGKKTLFTSKQINLKQSTNSLEAKQLKSRAALFLRGDRVDITVTPNQEYHRLDYSNLRDCLVGDVREQADRSARMFFEMVTSQQLINDDKYQMVSAGTLFEKQATDLKDNRGQPISGMSMRVGFKKGARVTEHTEAKAFIFLDLKRTAFFSTELMSELYKKMVRGNNREFERFFKGVRMQVVYDPSRTFLFGSLSQKNISDAAYKVNGQSIPDFMRAKKNITVALTNAPGVHPDQPNGRSILYPLEAIRPLEGQLVPLEKQSGFAIRALLMENSILPQDRFNYCNQQFLTISTGEGAKFLAQFGLSFVPNSNTIKVCANPMPKMTVGDKKVIQPKPNGSWNDEIVTAKLLKPTTKLKKWYVAFDQTVLNINFATNYIRSLMTEAEKSGIALPEPIEFVPTDMFKLEEVFKKALANKVQFIFYIDSQQKKSHGILKLFEAYYKILSQQIVDKNLRNGPQTLKNVLLKLNVKAFGLNYTPSPSPLLNDLRLECEDLLVIGYDIAPPEKLDAKGFADYCRRNKLNPSEKKIRSLHPAAVGVCGNKGLDPYAFTGDIFYQEANGGLVDPEMLSKAVENIVAEASKHRKNLARLIVFRDGVSEGEQSQVVIHELPAVRQGFAKGLARTQQNANIAVKVTFIVATKMHNKRFFRADGQKISNTRAGDSIRSDALRSDIKELYVQAHHPLKGMPKVPSFDVLVDEIKIPDQKLEHFIIYLSNMHQVSACPTSLPLPVFLADETAKRAEEIYKALLHYRGTREGERFGQELTRIKEIYDPNVLTAKLQYVGHPLYGTRFNA